LTSHTNVRKQVLLISCWITSFPGSWSGGGGWVGVFGWMGVGGLKNKAN